jgi:hypothetical protein
METIGYLEKFYIYKVASLPLEVTLRHWYVSFSYMASANKIYNTNGIQFHLFTGIQSNLH